MQRTPVRWRPPSFLIFSLQNRYNESFSLHSIAIQLIFHQKKYQALSKFHQTPPHQGQTPFHMESGKLFTKSSLILSQLYYLPYSNTVITPWRLSQPTEWYFQNPTNQITI